LKTLIRERINRSEMNLKTQAKTLLALSPWGVLDRGYALARTLPALELIRDAAGLPVGQAIRVTLASGEMDCRVEWIHKKKEDPPFVQRTF
jgi:exodeoxyribonuclease VII large subunit